LFDVGMAWHGVEFGLVFLAFGASEQVSKLASAEKGGLLVFWVDGSGI